MIVDTAPRQVARVSVAELLGYASMDAGEHRRGPRCPPGGPGACMCAGSVVRSILHNALAGVYCRSCGSRVRCRYQALRNEFERDGDFARPLHAPGRTVYNGHHRLAAALSCAAADLMVDTGARENHAAIAEVEAAWHAGQIVELVRSMPGWYPLGEVVAAIEEELCVSLAGNTPGAKRARAIVREARRCR